jgi:predicted RNA binding protein YcfA (HicA-like mRNA interferase family)
MRFPAEVPKRKVLKAFEILGFKVVREGNHIALLRENSDGTKTPLTMPNHQVIKGSTLLVICREVDITRDDFLHALDSV